ncbi:uncharacterized protein FA14DRAFT_8603 [Meira miltonrushii]|uniref:Uncharacterized protein n=1 Tax=Meira miltonrushii TaxID=1280837 RepID=A0A316VHD3_9BASI|nr:uncharacterized protein FA14DRAFT_8603 [Meira miltonrushii]PWN37002.1 hypothetical protein FA14DRAFT_8603 [Meira miltonrushii]
MSSTENAEDGGEEYERVDVRSRIAALNGQNRTAKAPTSSPKNDKDVIKVDDTQNRPEESSPPSIDVKSLSALYGGKQGASAAKKDSTSAVPKERKEPKPADDVKQVESYKPPTIPSRPVTQTKNGVPPQPPARPQGSSDTSGPPQLPPRLKEGTTSRSSTPTSIISESGAADSPLPYVPRRPTAAGRQAMLPAGRSTDEITEKVPYATREKPARKGMTISSSSGSLDTGKIAPTLPPRMPLPKSADAAQKNFPASNVSKLSLSPNHRQQTQSQTARRTSGPVAPPPRHVNTIRAPPKVAARAGQSGGGRLNNHYQFKQKRARRRDEHGQMVYSLDPDPKDKERYAQLYELQIALQAQQGGSAKVLEQEMIVRLWKRSKLDARFLQKVYDEASGVGEGVHQTEFVKAMAAIDKELARRRK